MAAISPPNIVFFLIDDLGWRDLACYGSSFYETPNLDRLARDGMFFSQAYASCPVCSPTRASIMSGKYPARVGVTQYIGGKTEGRLQDVPYLHYLPLEEKSLASALRDQGYQTWHVGKWHLGDEPFYPQHHGFDENIGGWHVGHPAHGYFSPWRIPTLEDGPAGEYLTDRLTDEALRLIRERDDRPFFLNFWHYAVHVPIQAPSALVEKYKRKAAAMGLDRVQPLVEGEHFPCLHKQEQRVTRRVLQSDPAYAAMVENMDASIGRVLAELEAQGLTDNTIVIFTSDNGGLSTAEGSPTCNHPLAEGKGWSYEGGTRVCQLVRWPGRVRPGSRCHVPVTSTDFYPTLLQAAGAPLLAAQHVDGVSLLPLLTESGELGRDAVFWHYPHYSNQGGTPAAAVVSGRWKLIHFFEDDRYELYDLALDLGEKRNLADRRPREAERLARRLARWQAEIEAAFPEPNPEYEAKLKRPSVPNNACE